MTATTRSTYFESFWRTFDERATAPHTVLLLIAGVPLRLSTTDAELAGIFFPHFRAREIADDGRPCASVRILSGASNAAGSTDLRADEDNVVVSYNPEIGQLSLWDRDSQRGVWWIGDRARLPLWTHSVQIAEFVHWALAGAGVAMVHSASVGQHGEGLLLVGASGAGKSTAAIACVDAGWDYVGDDYCALHPDGTTRNIYGVGRLTPSSVPSFPALASAAIAIRTHDQKTVYDFALHRPDQLREQLRLRAVVVPALGPVALLPQLIPPTRAALAVIPSTLGQLPAMQPESLRLISNVLRSVPVYLLTFGPERREAPAQLARLLADIVTGEPQ